MPDDSMNLAGADDAAACDRSACADPAEPAHGPGEGHAGGGLAALALGALGVVFGDIGTSPLYTLKTCIDSAGGKVDPTTLIGILSLITWSLAIVVALKYVVFIMRADNRGEGGILALTALAQHGFDAKGRAFWWIAAAGMTGAALFYGDGVITPAISVLSAVEGLKVAAPDLEPFVLPITSALLIGLFSMQSRGTGRVGVLFGPVMAAWFATLGVLGASHLADNPAVFRALDPLEGLELLAAHPWMGFVLMGSVVLAVTGGEALYADMGHFGRRPIRLAWFGAVVPSLILNYYGQGALLLSHPEAIANPFFHMAPGWATLPLVGIAAAATVIASQAVISGAFSLTRQAIQLGYLPRMEIKHTSASEIGQVYVPTVNRFLLIAVLALVLGFESSDSLAAAYGIAVTGTMAIDSVLAAVVAVFLWRWSPVAAVALFGLFLSIDLAFFGANALKVFEGGWFPLMVGIGMCLVMGTWRKGRQIMLRKIWGSTLPLEDFIGMVDDGKRPRIPGTAVFMSSRADLCPVALLHHLKHNKFLHERVVVMRIETCDIPVVADERRLEVVHLEKDFHTIVARYGFMEQPHVPKVLRECRKEALRFNLMETSFFLGREHLVAGKPSKLGRLRRSLFINMTNNALSATEFFRIPANRVVELGAQVEI